jgi:hypothetical protein
MSGRAAPALLPRERLPCGHLDIDENGKCVVCAAPKIESAEAPGADVAEQVKWLRLDEHPRMNAIADLLESLSTRCSALEGVIAEHNKRCERECDATPCDSLAGCVGCPLRYAIKAGK